MLSQAMVIISYKLSLQPSSTTIMSRAPITITTFKTSSQSSGLFLYKDENNRIIVNGISNGVFHNTQLKPFMEILSFNGISCDEMTVEFLMSLIDDADGNVTVVAREVIYEASVTMNEGNATIPSAPITYTPTPSAPYINFDSQIGQRIHNRTEGGMNIPRGCPPGGTWRQSRYPGTYTAMLCLVLACVFQWYSLCGLSAYCCPQDVLDVYVVHGKVSSCSIKIHTCV